MPIRRLSRNPQLDIFNELLKRDSSLDRTNYYTTINTLIYDLPYKYTVVIVEYFFNSRKAEYIAKKINITTGAGVIFHKNAALDLLAKQYKEFKG